MFIGGCGRFFEGTAEQMHHALLGLLGNLPEHTQVFCGHEYTLQNLKFAQYVEKDNVDIVNKIAWATEMRRNNQPTVSRFNNQPMVSRFNWEI